VAQFGGFLKRLFGSGSQSPGANQELTRINLALREEIEGHKQTEAKLLQGLESGRQAGDAKLRAFFDAASQPIVVVSGDGRIVLVNQRTAEMFGYQESELMGQPLEILLPERYRSAHVQHRKSYFAEPEVRSMGVGLDLAGRRKDGSEFPVEVGLSCVQTEDGLLAFGMIADITERKRAQQELMHVNAALRRSNAELEQFTYVASHDLQEPLRVVVSYLQLLERRYADRLDQDGLDFLHYAVDGATRMKQLMQDLLRLSRAGTQAVDFRQVAAGTLLEMAKENLKAAIDESSAVITTDALPPVVADAGLLTQVFQNLIANAIKFQTRGVQPRIHVSAAPQGSGWVFSVRDNGIGIEPRHAERIFRMFERLHGNDEYPGSGIGLAIAQRIVERHGGRIWVESTPGDGSTFHFSLPAGTFQPGTAAGSATAGVGGTVKHF
jgi:PAS domain S-box-containing protein